MAVISVLITTSILFFITISGMSKLLGIVRKTQFDDLVNEKGSMEMSTENKRDK